MSAQIISGKLVAERIYEELRERISRIVKECGRPPGLAVILVGDNPASQVYVKMKTKMCEKLGIFSRLITLDPAITQKDLLKTISELNNLNTIDGILIQLPIPRQLDEYEVLRAVLPDKDVDGFHPVNVGNLFIGSPTFVPCTPLGVWVLLKESGYSPEGKHVVIVGRSNIVGKPLVSILCQKRPYANATVTLCHSRTPDLCSITRTADILIAAIGQPEFIKQNMVKPGVVVIDVGVNRIDDPSSLQGYRLVGDVAYDEVSAIAAALTPVPGGVGPMTIAMLMHNTIYACERNNNISSVSIF